MRVVLGKVWLGEMVARLSPTIFTGLQTLEKGRRVGSSWSCPQLRGSLQGMCYPFSRRSLNEWLETFDPVLRATSAPPVTFLHCCHMVLVAPFLERALHVSLEIQVSVFPSTGSRGGLLGEERTRKQVGTLKLACLMWVATGQQVAISLGLRVCRALSLRAHPRTPRGLQLSALASVDRCAPSI